MASLNNFSVQKDIQNPSYSHRHRQSYENWRRDDLYHLAQRAGIENRANMTNEELARALTNAHGASS